MTAQCDNDVAATENDVWCCDILLTDPGFCESPFVAFILTAGWLFHSQSTSGVSKLYCNKSQFSL